MIHFYCESSVAQSRKNSTRVAGCVTSEPAQEWERGGGAAASFSALKPSALVEIHADGKAERRPLAVRLADRSTPPAEIPSPRFPAPCASLSLSFALFISPALRPHILCCQ